MLTELFVAVLTGNAGVGRLGEAFGMASVGQFPTEQKQKGQYDEAIRVRMRNEYEGREHHREIPVVDSAVGTASVFHKPGLEGAEKEDADHIANAVSEGDEYEYARVNDICEIEYSDRAVEGEPSRRDGESAPRGLQFGFFGLCRDKIAGKLLLTTGTFEL